MYNVMCIYTCITLLVKFQTSLHYSAARAFDPANKAIPNWIAKTIESVNDFFLLASTPELSETRKKLHWVLPFIIYSNISNRW